MENKIKSLSADLDEALFTVKEFIKEINSAKKINQKKLDNLLIRLAALEGETILIDEKFEELDKEIEKHQEDNDDSWWKE